MFDSEEKKKKRALRAETPLRFPIKHRFSGMLEEHEPAEMDGTVSPIASSPHPPLGCNWPPSPPIPAPPAHPPTAALVGGGQGRADYCDPAIGVPWRRRGGLDLLRLIVVAGVLAIAVVAVLVILHEHE